MFIYPLRAAGRLCGATEAEIDALGAYGEAFGRAFQTVDDLLDVTGRRRLKWVRRSARTPSTASSRWFPCTAWTARAALLAEETQKALDALARFDGRADFFRDLIRGMAYAQQLSAAQPLQIL